MSAAAQFGVTTAPRAEHRFFRDAGPTVTLLVESATDERFWRTHLHGRCLVRVATPPGRQGLEQELRKAQGDPGLTFLGVLDADYDRLEDQLPALEGAFWSDGVDLEATLLLRPGLLQKLLARTLGTQRAQGATAAWSESAVEAPNPTGGAGRGAQEEARWATTARARLLAFVAPAGRLRWLKRRVTLGRAGPSALLDALHLSKAARSGGSLSRFDRWEHCGAPGLEPMAEALLKQLLCYNNAQRHTQDIPALLEQLNTLPEHTEDQVCNGHDLLGALLAWMKSVTEPRRGSKKPHSAGTPGSTSESHEVPDNTEALTTRLYDACEREHLQGTAIWQALRAWQDAHPAFLLLPPI